MADRVAQITELTKLLNSRGPEALLSEDQLKRAFDAFRSGFVPELHDIFGLVAHKGHDSNRFYVFSSDLGPAKDDQSLEALYRISFMKTKSGEPDIVAITDHGFINVSLTVQGDKVQIQDDDREIPVSLDTPTSLTQPIPSSRSHPAGNPLGWIAMIAEESSAYKVLLRDQANQR